MPARCRRRSPVNFRLVKDCIREYWVPAVAIACVVLGVCAAISSNRIEVVVVDGCEYLRENNRNSSLVHKANCKNH